MVEGQLPRRNAAVITATKHRRSPLSRFRDDQLTRFYDRVVIAGIDPEDLADTYIRVELPHPLTRTFGNVNQAWYCWRVSSQMCHLQTLLR